MKEASLVQRQAVSEELADVFIYLVRLSDILGIDLIDVALQKVAKNEKRYPPDVIRRTSKKMP